MTINLIFAFSFRQTKYFKIFHFLMIYFFYFFILFLSILIILFPSKIKLYLLNHNLIIKQNVNYNNILKDQIYVAANEAKEFIYQSSNNLLIYKIPISLNKNIKISCIIPLYNCESTIKRAIRSIQNQNMSELEIILVNDFSLDNTSNIIQELSFSDKRIKIINNKINKGTLYTRCVGALFAKGIYIVPLDSDDFLLNYDVFSVLYKEARNNCFDIVLFKTIIANNISDFFHVKNLIEHRNHKNIIFMNQTKLGDYGIYSGVIWGKSIKTKIYKKAIKAYGKKRYSYYIIFGEDAIINYIIHQFAKSAIFILKFGILHIYRKNSVVKITNRNQRNLFSMKFIEVLYEFSKNTTKAKEIVTSKIIRLLKRKDLDILLLDVKIKNFFILLIKRILASKYISKNNKNLIKKNCKYIKFK